MKVSATERNGVAGRGTSVPRPARFGDAAAGLAAGLRTRREGLEEALRARAVATAGAFELAGRDCEGLQGVIAAALDYGLASLELDDTSAPVPVPLELLWGARRWARDGVGLDAVMRRYCAADAIFSDALIEEAQGMGISQPELRQVFRAQARALDHLLEAVGEEYSREVETISGSPRRSQRELVGGLLEGKLLDASTLPYDFEAHHLALAASGPGREQAIRALATSLDRRLLLVEADEESAWAWFGGSEPLQAREIPLACLAEATEGLHLGIGEPSEGMAGWRQGHRQAKAALSFALAASQSLVRYREACLLGTVLGDDLLSASLQKLYLAPLEEDRDGGETARRTLRAYFNAAWNISSAAAALGVSRQTASKRLATIEKRIGRPLSACAAELETALRLWELGER